MSKSSPERQPSTLNRARRSVIRSLFSFSLYLVASVAVHFGAVTHVQAQTARTVTTVDELLRRPTRIQGMARVEDETGTARAVYHPRPVLTESVSPDESARSILKADKRIGWVGRKEDLRLIDERRSRAGRHLTYQQYVDDVPVLGRYTRVSLDDSGRPTFVVNGFSPEVEKAQIATRPGIPAEAALASSRAVFPNGVTGYGDPELFVLPDETPKLVWRVVAWPEKGGEYEIYVDAVSGDLDAVRDVTLHRSHAGGTSESRRSVVEARRSSPAGSDYGSSAVAVDGQGLVFDPDPLATAGKPYAPPYVDDDDGDVPELNAERKLVTLHDITLGPDELHRLIGPHVEITGRRSNGQINYNPPEELNPDGFGYSRADERFESVMAYYHIDKSQRYVQSLGFEDLQNAPLPVNPFGEGNADVSNYYLNLNYLALGGGGVDDAEDAFVIWHEYAHALLNGRVPGLANTFDGTALHEGWSDYWAASYQREKFEKGQLPAGDWRRLFRWDGNNPAANWFGRQLPVLRTYPTDLTKSSVHSDGLVWASALMAVYDRLGRELTDELALQSHFYLSAPANMQDAAYAMIQADLDLYGGEHAGDLVSVLAGRGFVDATSFRTIVAHDPLPDTEQLGGSVEVVAEVTAIVSPVSSVTIHYATPIPGTAAMTSDDGVTFRGSFPLPQTPSVVSYYIEAVDEQSQVSRLPEGAPETPFVFVAGPDSEAPVIVHDPLDQISIFGWPPTIQATVTDNIALDTVFVRFTMTDTETSQVLLDSGFELAGDGSSFSGSFPDVEFPLRGRERVAYRLFAVDASASKNERQLPSEPSSPFEFNLSLSGTVAQFGFEGDDGATGDGEWQRGEPAFGTLFAHSGTEAWVTVLSGPYPATFGVSSLTLPAIEVAELDSLWLSFWHYYDIEHDGTAIPGSSVDATLWDGGNVLLSLDGGATWEIVTPEGGYDGHVATGAGNPKEGQPAFGGYSYGWRRELVHIPGGESVEIRFEFGTDVSNNESSFEFAGWAIDDVSFLVDRPEDSEPPVVQESPAANVELSSGSTPTPATITLSATDDVGIASVVATYDYSGPNGSGSGTVRLPMSPFESTGFTADIPIASGQTGPGTVIEYTVELKDFDGNVLVIPAGSQSYRFTYILVEETNLAAVATPSGGWDRSSAGWRIDSGLHLGQDASLVFSPVDLPTDATSIQLEVTHSFRLQSGAGGRVAVSRNDADNWEIIDPANGYPNEAAFFVGTANNVTSTYDLDDHAGQHVWLRLEMIAEQPLSTTDFWQVSSVRLVFKGTSETFDIPRSLELHPNYPNPFVSATTLTYSVPSQADVLIEAYDLLGRRVEVLLDDSKEAGSYTIRWQPEIAPGVYFIRLTSEGREIVRSVTRIR